MLNWIQVGFGAVAAFALSWLLHTVDVDRLEAKQAAALAAQQNALEKSCAEDKAITKGANDALQRNLDDISRKLASLKRLHSAACIVPTAGQAHPGAGGGEHARQNGISSDWLRDYAAECETYREQRLVLEKFIDDTWARK